ncbi:MAG: leucyl/phenylalanyl-tRNA--protein transferase [Gammaproteobacteria bacterium]|nr:MAG: leucyl/phenylalanyl-tRNA--protein transferase [Gammaproteobacteria bacterium]
MIPWLDPDDDQGPFPPPEAALAEPDGLLAAGGSLRPLRLLRAYRQGIFPWFNPGEPILWWHPSRRAVIFPEDLHLSRSTRKALRRRPFQITWNTAFGEVMRACAAPRRGQTGTWIGPDMIEAYQRLHRLGYARSVECWRDGELVGGIYGVQLGRVFFGESMFSRVDNASKAALAAVAAAPDVALIDCQLPNPHLERLGMVLLPRARFVELLDRWCEPALGSPPRVGRSA